MKTLVIPDIHLKWHIADRILEQEKDFDLCIFLGDYFDDFHDTPLTNEKMAEWIRAKIDDPRFVFLLGNHDLAYVHGGRRSVICPGFTPDKNRVINKHLFDHWDKFKYYFFHSGILFSHAGVSDLFLRVKPDSVADLEEYLNNELRFSLREVFELNSCPRLLGAGHDRGGNQDIGGIVWCDHMCHIPLTVIPQIYGHTPLRQPDYRIRNVEKNHTFYCGVNDSRDILKDFHINKPWSLCLDTHLKHYGVIENKTLYIRCVNRYDSPTNTDFDTVHIRQLK